MQVEDVTGAYSPDTDSDVHALRGDGVETSFECSALRIRTWESGRTGLKGDMAAEVSVCLAL